MIFQIIHSIILIGNICKGTILHVDLTSNMTCKCSWERCSNVSISNIGKVIGNK